MGKGCYYSLKPIFYFVFTDKEAVQHWPALFRKRALQWRSLAALVEWRLSLARIYLFEELKVKEPGVRASFSEGHLGFSHTGLQFLFFRRTVSAY